MDQVKEEKNSGVQGSEMKPTPESSAAPTESVAFAAGRKARSMGVPITQSALRNLRPGCQQYYDFIDGYDYEAAQRKRKPKAQRTSEQKR